MLIKFGTNEKVDYYFANQTMIFDIKEIISAAVSIAENYPPRYTQLLRSSADCLINVKVPVYGNFTIACYEDSIQILPGKVSKQLTQLTFDSFGVTSFDVVRRALRRLFPDFHSKNPVTTLEDCFSPLNGVQSIWTNLVRTRIFTDKSGVVCIQHPSGLTYRCDTAKNTVVKNLRNNIYMLCLVRTQQRIREGESPVRHIADLTRIGIYQMPAGFESRLDHRIWKNVQENFWDVMALEEEKEKKKGRTKEWPY